MLKNGIGWLIPLLCLLAQSRSFAFELTIVHTNDMHASLGPVSGSDGYCHDNECFGGFPKVKFFTDYIKSTYKNVLFLNAGDNFQGTTYYSLYKWKPIKDFVDALGIDVMSLGNHEFDDGSEGLVPYLEVVKTPWVCANLLTEGDPVFHSITVEPMKFINVQDRRIAVIGYLTPETKDMEIADKVNITDEISSLNDWSKKARDLGADIIIALGHSGWDKDLEIARNVPELDLVVGGHSHTFIYTGIPPVADEPVAEYPHFVEQESGKRVPVVQAKAYTKYVGLLQMTFDNNSKLIHAEGNPVLMDETIPEDKKLQKMLDVLKADSERRLQQRIGRLARDMLADDCRVQECALGNLIADALFDYGETAYHGDRAKGWTDSPVAIVNSGVIRTSLYQDKDSDSVTLGALLTSIPYDESIMKVSVNGSILKDMMEHSVYKYNPDIRIASGLFLQFSGVRVVYDVRRKPGDRVISAYVRCGQCPSSEYSPLTPDMNVTLLTSSYLAMGGDGYSMLKSAQKEGIRSIKNFEVVKNYINKTSPVDVKVEGRIRFLSTEDQKVADIPFKM